MTLETNLSTSIYTMDTLRLDPRVESLIRLVTDHANAEGHALRNQTHSNCRKCSELIEHLFPKKEKAKTYCSLCFCEQKETPSGLVCKYEHGGAASLAKKPEWLG